MSETIVNTPLEHFQEEGAMGEPGSRSSPGAVPATAASSNVERPLLGCGIAEGKDRKGSDLHTRAPCTEVRSAPHPAIASTRLFTTSTASLASNEPEAAVL